MRLCCWPSVLLGFLVCLFTRASGEEATCLLAVKRPPMVVFYHLWVNTSSDASRVAQLVREQLKAVSPEQQELRVSSLGALKNIEDLGLPADVEKKAQWFSYEGGWEDVTLARLWSFCKDADPSQVVAYLHSKGSYTDSENNTRLRKYLAAGVFSEGCQKLPPQCDVCSSRMSPIPHPHYGGNMWTARCGYIARLKDPQQFPGVMETFRRHTWPHRGDPDSCIGTGRFAFEHWALSHPTARPCDVDASSDPAKYTWNYDHIPAESFPQLVQPAPRYDFGSYLKPGECDAIGGTRRQRLAEYESVYNQTPPTDWWGWTWYPD